MRIVVAVCCLGLAVWLLGAEGKVLSREEILRQLEATVLNNDRKFLSNWICLVEQESGGDTRKVTNHENLSFSYGVFQINSTDGCGKGYTGGHCGIKCEDLLTDKIDNKNANCANKYWNLHGFKGWHKWTTGCKLKKLPSIQVHSRGNVSPKRIIKP